MTKAGKRKKTSTFWTAGNISILIVLTIIFGSWLYFPYLIQWVTGVPYNDENIGKLADAYGVMNTLFTGLSISALVVTILIQQKEISDTQRRSRLERFENTFFKYIDLRNAIYEGLKESFANFEKDIIVANLKAYESLEETKKRYQDHIEKPDVVKNFVNYLAMFDIMVNAINRKTERDSRIKYYTLLSAQLHVNEKRFFLYHFTLSKTRPQRWDELKVYLLAGLTKHAIHIEFRNLTFDGLD